jgi:hypothetical protein
MTWGILNKSNKKCVICRHWYDPSGSCLKPHMGDFYKFDQSAKKPCAKHGQIEKPSWAMCPDFITKL